MRSENEIIHRLRTYQENIKGIRPENKIVIKQAILELSWVLGEESNENFDIRKNEYR